MWIQLLPLGLIDGAGSAVPVPPVSDRGLGGDDVPRRNPNKGWNKAEWKRLRKDPLDAIEATLRQAYKELTEGPAPVVAQVQAIVKVKPKAQEPNWSAIAANYQRANALYKLWQEERDLHEAMEAMEDDDVIMMLL